MLIYHLHLQKKTQTPIWIHIKRFQTTNVYQVLDILNFIFIYHSSASVNEYHIVSLKILV